jgi:hypothetical protein
MAAMMVDDHERIDLGEAVVRICPACGVVNPGGPSKDCPHVQLVRFDGIDDLLAATLGELAASRRRYNELLERLKARVMEEVRTGRALVETPRRVRTPADGARPAALDPPERLSLTHPEPPRPRPQTRSERPARRRKRNGAPTVDSRQLDLLAQSPPKGEA